MRRRTKRRRSPRGSSSTARWPRPPGPASPSSRRRSPPTSRTTTSTRVLRPTVTGALAWCLLFSEPGAGTDLANLTTTATRDGDGWRLDGRKTWATGAHVADRALVLARSDPDGARHRGLTCFVLDMRQPDAVEVRPMREMTGRALSNDVVVARGLDDHRARRRRRRLARRQHGAVRRALVGRRAPFVAGPRRVARAATSTVPPARSSRGPAAVERRPSAPAPDVVARAAATGVPRGVVRDRLAGLHAAAEVARLDGRARAGACRARRTSPSCGPARSPGAARRSPRPRREPTPCCTTTTIRAPVTSLVLSSPAVSLVGGVDLVQRDLLGERVLGLPKAPDLATQKTPSVEA